MAVPLSYIIEVKVVESYVSLRGGLSEIPASEASETETAAVGKVRNVSVIVMAVFVGYGP